MQKITKVELRWIINEIGKKSQEYKEIIRATENDNQAALARSIANTVSENYDNLVGKLQKAIDGDDKRIEIK